MARPQRTPIKKKFKFSSKQSEWNLINVKNIYNFLHEHINLISSSLSDASKVIKGTQKEGKTLSSALTVKISLQEQILNLVFES